MDLLFATCIKIKNADFIGQQILKKEFALKKYLERIFVSFFRSF